MYPITYLDLSLFELQLLLELARAFQSSGFVRILGRLQVFQGDVAKSEEVAHNLFLRYAFGPAKELIGGYRWTGWVIASYEVSALKLSMIQLPELDMFDW